MARFPTRYGEAADWWRPARRLSPDRRAGMVCGAGTAHLRGQQRPDVPHGDESQPASARLDQAAGGLGVRLVTRAEWTGWEHGGLAFRRRHHHAADAVVLALGGASWPSLGADGGWTALLPDIGITPLRPANYGFRVDWSAHFVQRFAGTPLKRVTLVMR